MIDYTNDIRDVIKESSDLKPDELSKMTNDSSITELGIDSLSLVEVMITLEKKYNIEINPEDVGGDLRNQNMDLTINELNTIINKKLNTL